MEAASRQREYWTAVYKALDAMRYDVRRHLREFSGEFVATLRDEEAWVGRLCWRIWVKAEEYARFRQKARHWMLSPDENEADEAAHYQPMPKDERILAAEARLREIVGDLVEPSDRLSETLTIEADEEDCEDENLNDDFNADWSWQWLMVEFGPIIRDISPVIARFYREEPSPFNRLAGQDVANMLIDHGFAETMEFIWRHLDSAQESDQ
jgi:hypothetical protein